MVRLHPSPGVLPADAGSRDGRGDRGRAGVLSHDLLLSRRRPRLCVRARRARAQPPDGLRRAGEPGPRRIRGDRRLRSRDRTNPFRPAAMALAARRSGRIRLRRLPGRAADIAAHRPLSRGGDARLRSPACHRLHERSGVDRRSGRHVGPPARIVRLGGARLADLVLGVRRKLPGRGGARLQPD